MRFKTAIRLAVPMMLSAALSALPSVLPAETVHHAALRAAKEPVRIVGRYTLTMAGKQARQRAYLVVEEGITGYTGLLFDAAHESPLSDVEIIDETLHATVMTSTGRATLVLHLTDKGVVGTLRLAKLSLALKGERAI